MAAIRKLIYCFSGDDLGATARGIVLWGLTPVGFPEEVEVDMQPVRVDDEWVDTLVAGIGKSSGANWNGMMDCLTIERDCVRGQCHEYELAPPSLVRRLGRIPCTVASFAPFHDWSSARTLPDHP